MHLPLSAWILRKRRALGRCCVVGVAGPQGSGKSTAAMVVQRLLEAQGLRVAALSIDDVYLPRAERLQLAKDVHPLLAPRGPPGSHDLPLAAQVLQQLVRGESLALPRFDKASDDRRPLEAWDMFHGPADVVLLEGWCVGARPQDPAAQDVPVNELERLEDPRGVWRRHANEALQRYRALFSTFDLLVQFVPPDFETVVRWRQEQEAKLRARGAEGYGVMSDAEVVRFVSHYERLTRHMFAEMPARADICIRLGPDRDPVSMDVCITSGTARPRRTGRAHPPSGKNKHPGPAQRPRRAPPLMLILRPWGAART